MKKLNESALLLDLDRSLWKGRKFDKKASEETAIRYDADKKNIRVRKRLIKTDAISELLSCARRVKTIVERYGIQWGRSCYLIPTKNFQPMMDDVNPVVAQFNEELEIFIRRYEDWMTESIPGLGTLGNKDEYPSIEAMRCKWKIKLSFRPVPDTGGMFSDMSKDSMKELREQMEDEFKSNSEEAVKELWARMYDVVESLKNQLESEKFTLRQATVDKIDDMIKNMPNLNVFGNKELTGMTKQVKKELGNLAVTDLKENEGIKQERLGKAKELLEKISTYCTPLKRAMDF